MKKTPKQIAALVCVVLIVLFAIITLVLAFCDFEGSKTLFAGFMGLTLALPIFAWLFIWMFGRLTGKDTFVNAKMEKTESDREDSEESDDNV